jgi:hypothetical protein
VVRLADEEEEEEEEDKEGAGTLADTDVSSRGNSVRAAGVLTSVS